MSTTETLSKEKQHFSNVLKAFGNYLPYCLTANDARRRSFYSLPRAHQELLLGLKEPLPGPLLHGQSASHQVSSGFRAKLDEIDDRIRRNADLLEQIVEYSKDFLGEGLLLPDEEGGADDDPKDQLASARGNQSHSDLSLSESSETQAGTCLQPNGKGGPQRRRKRKVSGHQVDKIQSTLKQLVRDWSAEGRAERELAYRPIVQAIEACFGHVPKANRGEVRILVPGAGLGRLAFDLATHGYSCQGNEFSFYMLLTSHFILNKTTRPNEHVIYPFIHSSSNWRSAGDMLRPIQIPDILPAGFIPPEADFSMVAGEFVEVYSKPEEGKAWDAVATCFFIDTAHNLLRYLEVINHCLPVGGVWINAGPLLWHFENTGGEQTYPDNLSIELTLGEVLELVIKMGFEIEQKKTLPPMTYTGNIDGMLKYDYIPEFFLCRKIKDVEASPAV
ncbi:N2227-domain-containing protein [Violaceomyces palustris]|uniref:N2227-domain-containing protein n=1 Tax=Violaceomyces palustris TaxID=1673888 RepID=A0ACD0NV29_9BASI|nr:N2227-domain-containing protein [Violaceomyces palustris]